MRRHECRTPARALVPAGAAKHICVRQCKQCRVLPPIDPHPLQPSEPRQLSFQGRLLIQAGIAARIDSLSNVYICFPCPEVLTWQQVDPKPPRRHAVQTSTLQPRTPYSHRCTYTYGVELDLCLYVSWERSDHKGKYAWLKLEAAQKFHVLKA